MPSSFQRKRDMKQMFHIILLLHLWVTTIGSAAAASSLAKPGCQETCGNVVIPYPFGIGANCSFHEGFAVTCNDSFNPPKPFIDSINLEALQIYVNGSVQVNNPVITSNCSGRENGRDVNMLDTPFSFSDTYNRFTAMGCDNLALITRQANIITGCMSICNPNSSDTGCFGINCCQTAIPRALRFINASLRNIDPNSDQNDCKYAFMVDYQWFSAQDIYAARDMEYVPAVLDWGINGTCDTNGTNKSTASFCGTNAYCSRMNGSTQCFCEVGYEGNPYLSSGCQDIDECSDPSLNSCERICLNTPGGYNCTCPDGYLSLGDNCLKLPNNSNSRTKVIVVGTCSGLGIVLLLITMWWLHREVKRRREIKIKEKFFKRNGGLLLQQQLLSDVGDIEATKLFTSKELEKATDNYNVNRILGQGGQGTVYKGMLTDGRIVAIKRSKIVDEGRLEQFINEVVILSQINHRNVVKLFGCCLETDVPMLVYEFIPNGTLFHYIHDQSDEFPLSWDLRLRIAAEVAGALSYLHSAASIAIYHRDIKSSNILLDEKFRAKVSDFGISRSISEDKTHLTTSVQGTFGYLDPEYFRSSQFTDKSDVYSFGVVLVELLTGEKPILSAGSEEERSLVTHFIMRMKENHLYDILDARVAKEGGKGEILAVANLAKRCFYLKGRKRPTMKEVLMELDGVRLSKGASSTVKQTREEEEFFMDELTGSWEAASTSTGSYIATSAYPTSTDSFFV